MTALIERDFEFQSGVHFQDIFLVNFYSFTLYIEVNTDSVYEQNIAMERLKYMVYEVFENSVFVHSAEAEAIEKYINAGLRVVLIPDEPYDQILALILMLKLNSICENRLKVIEILLTSKLSDEVKFRESIATAQITFPDDDWYNQPSPKLSVDKDKKIGKEKIVKLQNNEWKEAGLIWKEKKEKVTQIVFNPEPNK